MYIVTSVLLAAATTAAPMGANFSSETDQLTDVILVTGGRLSADDAEQVTPMVTVASADAAALVARTAGAALVGNGAISGQVQYRGLFSDRLAIRVNGQSFQSGGPNAMDPPLHYAPMILVDHIRISRGTGPVRDGMGLGGSLDARLKQVDFAASPEAQVSADMGAAWRSADQSYALGGVSGISSDRWRVQALGAYEKGDDMRLGGGGKARATSFERLSYGLGGGFRHDGGEIGLEWRRQETSPSGNPAFAMDIDYFHTDFLRARTDNQFGDWTLETALGFTRVTHGMSNHGLRPAPEDGSKWRYSSAQAETMTAAVSLGNQHLRIGADGQWVDRNVRITNPNNSEFWISSLNHVAQRRLGFFAELRQDMGALSVELGGRLDFHRSRMADPMVGSAAPMMVANLARQIALINRPLDNQTGDAVLRLWTDQGDVKPRLTLAYKQRVPNAVERHSWMPTEASGGLADGNIYVGDANLRPEKAWIAEAGVDVEQRRWRWRPSIFYRRIDDYIQGVAVPSSMASVVMIAGMNGDSTPLIFANVDAQLYGADMDVAWKLGGPWHMQGTLSYVRGKRRDVGDNLYRIAPLNGRISLHWQQDAVSLGGELVGAAAQKKVSRTNDERASPSWLIGNLWAEWAMNQRVHLAVGVENLWDQRAADHLSAINRVMQSDVAVGQRLPMAGRGASLRLNISL